MTSVLFERVKVDNLCNFFHASGKKMLEQPIRCERLQYMQWQPYPEGSFQEPSIQFEVKSPEVRNANKPKRIFAYGGGNSAFAQAMRQEMGKTSDKGSRKLD